MKKSVLDGDTHSCAYAISTFPLQIFSFDRTISCLFFRCYDGRISKHTILSPSHFLVLRLYCASSVLMLMLVPRPPVVPSHATAPHEPRRRRRASPQHLKSSYSHGTWAMDIRDSSSSISKSRHKGTSRQARQHPNFVLFHPVPFHSSSCPTAISSHPSSIPHPISPHPILNQTVSCKPQAIYRLVCADHRAHVHGTSKTRNGTTVPVGMREAMAMALPISICPPQSKQSFLRRAVGGQQPSIVCAISSPRYR